MTTSDKILEFIDGTLEGADEQTLFDAMARLPELRTELRHYVQIGDAVRADREAYVPPADVERRLLGGLGLIPLAATGGGAVAGGTAGMLGLLGLKSGLLPMMLGFILGGLLVGGGVWLVLDDDDDVSHVALRQADGNLIDGGTVDGGTVDGGVHANREGVASRSGVGTNGIADGATGWMSSIDRSARGGSSPITSSGGSQAPTTSTPTVIYRDRIKYLKAPTSSSKQGVKVVEDIPTTPTRANTHNPASPTTPQDARTVTLMPIATPPPALQVDRPDDRRIDGLKMQAPSSTPIIGAPTAEGRSMRLELRKSVAERPFVENNARPVETQLINDFFSEGFVGGVHYDAFAKTSIGLEVGRERFSQSLLYNRADTLIIEQRPAILWAAIAVNHDVRPFGVPLSLGVSLGGSEYAGPLVRGRVGFDLLDLFGARLAGSPLSVPITGEISSLVYTYNDQYMITGNLGLTAGVSYRFGF